MIAEKIGYRNLYLGHSYESGKLKLWKYRAKLLTIFQPVKMLIIWAKNFKKPFDALLSFKRVI